MSKRQIGAQFPADMVDRFDAFKDGSDLDQSEALRRLVDRGLAAYEHNGTNGTPIRAPSTFARFTGIGMEVSALLFAIFAVADLHFGWALLAETLIMGVLVLVFAALNVAEHRVGVQRAVHARVIGTGGRG